LEDFFRVPGNFLPDFYESLIAKGRVS
jgi:hypothetical protein